VITVTAAGTSLRLCSVNVEPVTRSFDSSSSERCSKSAVFANAVLLGVSRGSSTHILEISIVRCGVFFILRGTMCFMLFGLSKSVAQKRSLRSALLVPFDIFSVRFNFQNYVQVDVCIKSITSSQLFKCYRSITV
jgi:hypothetical protein